LFDDPAGDVIYRVPRRYPGLARVVETSVVGSLPAIDLEGELKTLRSYAEALERGPDSPALTEWENVNAMRIRAEVAAGQSVVVQIAYDPQWRAESGGVSLEIRKDVFGQMLITAPPGRHDIRLEFETPLENQVGKLVSLFSALIVVVLLIFR
jgi:uncharacterized membrane protein YfhO